MLLFLVMLAAGASAEDADALTKRLQKEVSEGRWSSAASTTRALDALIAAKAPLVVSDGRVLKALPQGLGIYDAASDGMVRSHELILYAQVNQHVSRQTRDGFELHLSSDLIVRDAEGHELARDEGFGEQRFTARTPHRDTFVTATLNVTGLPSGRYSVRWVIHDRLGEKSANIDIAFVVPAAPAADPRARP